MPRIFEIKAKKDARASRKATGTLQSKTDKSQQAPRYLSRHLLHIGSSNAKLYGTRRTPVVRGAVRISNSDPRFHHRIFARGQFTADNAPCHYVRRRDLPKGCIKFTLLPVGETFFVQAWQGPLSGRYYLMEKLQSGAGGWLNKNGNLIVGLSSDILLTLFNDACLVYPTRPQSAWPSNL